MHVLNVLAADDLDRAEGAFVEVDYGGLPPVGRSAKPVRLSEQLRLVVREPDVILGVAANRLGDAKYSLE